MVHSGAISKGRRPPRGQSSRSIAEGGDGRPRLHKRGKATETRWPCSGSPPEKWIQKQNQSINQAALSMSKTAPSACIRAKLNTNRPQAHARQLGLQSCKLGHGEPTKVLTPGIQGSCTNHSGVKTSRNLDSSAPNRCRRVHHSQRHVQTTTGQICDQRGAGGRMGCGERP